MAELPKPGDEAAKAVQEVARATGKALDVVRELGGFLADITNMRASTG